MLAGVARTGPVVRTCQLLGSGWAPLWAGLWHFASRGIDCAGYHGVS
jgi:hypothetical protein